MGTAKLIWFNITLKILDVATTYYALTSDKRIIEFNPIVRKAMSLIGIVPTLYIVFAVFAVVMLILYRLSFSAPRKVDTCLKIIMILMSLVVINNSIWLFVR